MTNWLFRLCIAVWSCTSISMISAQKDRCGVDSYYASPFIKSSIKPTPGLLETRSIYTLPVVIHIIWHTPAENISDLQIQRQIERLNLDFNQDATGRNQVPAAFRSQIGNPQIRFCLVTKDSDGKPHPGITRTYTDLEQIGSKKDAQGRYLIHYTSLGGHDGWDPNRYINIWIGQLNNVFGRSTIGGRISTVLEDGIVIAPIYFNAQPSINLLGRTLVHEMGHYLGLLHPWGQVIGDCDEEDGMPDTPPQEGPYYDCPTYPQISCEVSSMYMNYMDYIADECMQLFTKDQTKEMIAVLNNSRSGLKQSVSSCMPERANGELDNIQAYVSDQSAVIRIQAPTLFVDKVDITVLNTMGQTLLQKNTYLTPNTEIYTKDWSPGIYFLYFRYSTKSRTIKLFIP